MRFGITIVAAIAVFYFGAYRYLKYMPLDSQGLTIPQTLLVAGVRREMTHIADVEQEYLAINSDCLSIKDLISEEKLKEINAAYSTLRASEHLPVE